jgi:hypothetical protein
MTTSGTSDRCPARRQQVVDPARQSHGLCIKRWAFVQVPASGLLANSDVRAAKYEPARILWIGMIDAVIPT